MSASQTQQSGRQDLEQLAERGLTSPERFAALPAEVIAQHLRRYDSDPSASVGALDFRLKQELERQQRPGVRASRDVLAKEAAYGRRIVDLLQSRFPEVCTDGRAHPGAVLAVIHAHHRNGKQQTVAQLRPHIIAGVRAFDERHGDPQDGER